eukprot:g63039.t1
MDYPTPGKLASCSFRGRNQWSKINGTTADYVQTDLESRLKQSVKRGGKSCTEEDRGKEEKERAALEAKRNRPIAWCTECK